MEKLATIILEYESDTFSAIGSALTPTDAHAIALVLFDRLCKVVAEGGTLRCDGDVLSDILDEMRPNDDEDDEPEPWDDRSVNGAYSDFTDVLGN